MAGAIRLGWKGMAMISNHVRLDLEDNAIESRQLQNKFDRLRDEWKKQRRHESSTIKMVTLPAYQNIIGMGPAALPFLLRELEHDLDAWFWALTAITEADPVPEHLRGDGEAMAHAWLEWARSRGIQW